MKSSASKLPPVYIFIEGCLLLANVYYSMFPLEKKDNNQALLEI
jgi:hypothetical protein